MTGTTNAPNLKSAFKTADRPGNKRVSLGKLVRTSSGHTYPANAINQYHEQNPRTKKGFRQWNGNNSSFFGPSTHVTRDPDDKETTWQQRGERHNAMTEAAEGIDYDPRPPGNISKEQQLEIYKNNAPTINNIWGDDGEDYEQTPEEVQDIIDDLKKQLEKPMTDYNKEEVQNQIAEFEDQLKNLKNKLENIDVGGAKKNRKTKSKRKENKKTKSKRKAKKNTKKKTKRKAKGNTKKRR